MALTTPPWQLTSGHLQYYNLQVQVNNQATISTLKETAKIVATALVPTDGSWTAVSKSLCSELELNIPTHRGSNLAISPRKTCRKIVSSNSVRCSQ